MASQPRFAVINYKGIYCEFFARVGKLRKNNPRYMARAKAKYVEESLRLKIYPRGCGVVRGNIAE